MSEEIIKLSDLRKNPDKYIGFGTRITFYRKIKSDNIGYVKQTYNINQPNRVFVDSNGTQYTVFFNNIKTINGKKLIKESTDKVINVKDTLGIPRNEMPQIQTKFIPDFKSWLSKNNIVSKLKNVEVSKLNLTQKDINLDKVKDIINQGVNGHGIIICSKDFYILDGHHRVIAQQYLNPNKIIKVLVVDLDIYRLLDICKKYKRTFKKDITEMKLQNIIRQIIKEEVSKSLNEDNSKYQEVFDSINWNDVEKEILKVFKIKTKLSFELNGKYVSMTSDNFIKQCGVFQYALGSCKLEFFNRELNIDTDKENKFWGTISLDYPGNGLRIGTMWISQDNKIIIQKETPRQN